MLSAAALQHVDLKLLHTITLQLTHLRQTAIETQEEQDMLHIKVELDVNFLIGVYHVRFNR